LASSPVVKVSITFRDRDGNSAVLTVYCAFATPIADAWTFALAMVGVVTPLSDGLIVAVQIAYRWTMDDPATPAESSNIERKLLLLHVNSEDEINGMIIPSPRIELFETLGNYAGIRLDLASTGALAWIDMLTRVELLTREGHELGVLAVGGLAY
jgi:hypothetical protein